MSEELVGTVTSGRAGEFVPLDDARIALSDGYAGNVHEITRLEKIEGYFAARVILSTSSVQPKLLELCPWRNFRLLEMARMGLLTRKPW